MSWLYLWLMLPGAGGLFVRPNAPGREVPASPPVTDHALAALFKVKGVVMRTDQRVGTPSTVRSILCIHTCWGLAHAEWVKIADRTRLEDGSIRYIGVRCDGASITLIEAGWGWTDLEPGWSNPCCCWSGPAILHEGHCCFATDECTEHDEIVRAWLEKLPVGDIPMYPEDEPRPWR